VSIVPHALEVMLEAAVMGATYGMVHFTHTVSRHMAASPHWKYWKLGWVDGFLDSCRELLSRRCLGQ
jgi:hypothetical protein